MHQNRLTANKNFFSYEKEDKVLSVCTMPKAEKTFLAVVDAHSKG